MSTTNEPRRKKTTIPRDGVFRFTLDQFAKLDELGFFADRRVEILRGVIYEMTINPGHASAMRLIGPVLNAIFGVGWVVSGALPLNTGRRSLLEPDFTVVAGSVQDFLKSHPTTAALVVEISNATLRKDRTTKAHLYAQAGLPDYWIVNLVDRQLEVHRNPGADRSRKGRFRYEDVTIVSETGRVAPLSAPDSLIAVSDLLP